MTPEKPRMQFSLFSLLIGIAPIAFVLAAFSRGNYILGAGTGTFYAVIALMIVVVLVRAIRERPVPKLRLAFFVLFFVPACLAFAFPSYINSDYRYFIDQQREDRDARDQLHAVFSGDAAFSDLSISTTHTKGISVEISGTVPNRTDLDRVKQLVFERCNFVKHCFVHWRIRVRSDSKIYVARMDEPFVPE